ncbi:exopolysaccharide biosynthesis protein [Pseudooceanicola sp.]|uniref:exopolysaccharide biosynthesis protein n=1 Tax=Pseudooceanicola sp. TaxID=1914328 RepID=UPI004059B969
MSDILMTPPPPIADARAATSTIGGRPLRGLTDILDALDHAARTGEVSVGDVLTEIGIRSFAPLILVPAIILVSPLSGIPGLPTVGALFMLLVAVQKLMGRPHVWMPEVLKRRTVGAERLRRATGWLRRPSAWIDARTHSRLTLFVTRGANVVTLLVIAATCLLIPFLEILPMVTSLFATGISFFALGLLARDGLFTLFGYAWTGMALAALWWLVSAAT